MADTVFLQTSSNEALTLTGAALVERYEFYVQAYERLKALLEVETMAEVEYRVRDLMYKIKALTEDKTRECG